jgi:hypothetical protein
MVEPDLEASAAERPCTNCGSTLLGEYCFRCGQRRVEPDQLSVRHFVNEAIAHLSDIEHTKIFRTARTLLLRPGVLTNEYLAGRRAQWVTPLKLYFTIFAISFFLYSAFKSVAVYDLATLIQTDQRGVLRKGVAALAERKHVALDVFITAVNAKWRTYISFSQIVYPIFFALALALFYLRQRRYFAEHLIFSIHYQAFALLLVVLAWPLYLLTGLTLTHRTAILATVVTILMIAYLIVAVRAAYGQSWLASSVKGVVLYLVYYVIFTCLTYGMLALATFVVMRGG